MREGRLHTAYQQSVSSRLQRALHAPWSFGFSQQARQAASFLSSRTSLNIQCCGPAKQNPFLFDGGHELLS
jgi:hypothetical protein